MNRWQRFLPGLVVAVAGAFLAWKALPPRDTGAMHLTEMAKLPIVAHGRVKPLDTLARTSLTIVSNRQTFKNENGKSGQPAIRWLMDVFTSDLLENKAAFDQEVFRIENDQLLNLLQLKAKPEFYRYSYREIAPNIKKLETEAIRAKKVEARQRSAFDQKTLELANHLQLFVDLAQWHDFLPVPPQSQGQEWQTLSQGLIGWPAFAESLAKAAHGQRDEKVAFSLAKAYEEARNSRAEPPAGAFLGLLEAYSQGNAEQFNSRLAEYQQQLEELVPKQARIARWETFFNDFAPFYYCSWLYLVAILLVCFAWLFYPPFARSAFWLSVLILVVHTWAILMRMYIQGRPPVTNLYSSAVFIGWAGVILGLLLEGVFRNGLGTGAGAVLGSLTLILAHHLAASGDTMEMLQAVLDTNFWLATHVVVVNLGYMATFVAGVFGATYVIAGVFTNGLSREFSKTLTQMMYGVVCFATFLSFTGTVLGGIWADQSWGRFWGWDPKENGALMIVLINALFLHARWAGMVKQRGLAVLTLVGSMITAWSYFGTNQLGVGLHSYGFSDELAVGLVVFWAFHAGLIGVGLMPLKWWRSFAKPNATTPLPT